MALRYHVERRIAATPERVWALLADVASWRAWNPTIVSIDGDVAVGGTVRLVTTINPKRTFTVRVTEVDAPRTMRWSDGMPFGLFTGERTFRLSPSGDGTDFAMTEEYSGALAGLIGRSIPDMSGAFAAFADGLRAAAEAPAATTADR